MEQTNLVPALPAPPRRSGVSSRPSDAIATGALHPLEARRIAAGYNTPAELADAAGLSRGGVVNIEQGAVAKARTGTARALATALSVPLDVLLSELRNPAGGINPAHPQDLIVAVRFSKRQRVRYLGSDPKAAYDHVVGPPGEGADVGIVIDGPAFGPAGRHNYEIAWTDGETTWTPVSFIEAIA